MSTITRGNANVFRVVISSTCCLLVALFMVGFFSGLNKATAASSYIVAKDGSGNFTTVQAAINAVPANNTSRVVIYIKNGTYQEVVTVPSNKPFITLYGQSKTGTIITYNNYASKTKPDGTTYGTTGSASVFIQANDFIAIDVTFQNSHGAGSQAVAAYVASDRAYFYDCQFLGWQDTLFANSGRQYYRNNYIQGSVDYIFGDATAVFENSHLNNIAGGSITAQSRTSSSETTGYVFINDSITGTPANSTILGRPWRAYARVVFLTCAMANDITAVGWNDWGNAANQQTAYFAEYNSTGAGANPSGRVSWSHQLTASQAAQFSVANFLNQDGWLTTAGVYLTSLLKAGFLA